MRRGLLAEDGVEGGDADEATDEQRGDAKPGFDFWEERHREPCRCGEQASKGGGDLVSFHGGVRS